MTPPNMEKRPRLVLVPAGPLGLRSRLVGGRSSDAAGRPSPILLQCLPSTPLLAPLDRGTACFVQSSPAPRAHLYLAPSTATGISVEYGYAGMPCWNRCSAASSTCTSPASDATIGLWMPAPSSRRRPRRRDSRTPSAA